MALVSKKDFASALNIAYGTIRSKFSRKQLCCNRKGLVDTEHPLNYTYLLEVNGGDQSVFDDYHISGTNVKKKVVPTTKKETKVTNKVEKVVEVPISKVVPVVDKTPKLTAEERKVLQEQKKVRDSLASFEIRKKEAEVTLVERNAELKQWELEKKAGNTLPLDMIESVLGINFKAIFKTNFSLANNVAMVIVQQLGGSKEDLHSIRKELENVFDKTVKDAEKKASVDIDKLIDEYSEVRSRGERKV